VPSWRSVAESGHIRVGESLCLEAPVAFALRAAASVVACRGRTKRQRWTHYASGQLVSHSGRCLVPGHPGVEGSPVLLRSCTLDAHHQTWSVVAATPGRSGHPPTPRSAAPVLDFYMYRAASDVAPEYEFGNINTGNMDGVIWYLMNEVVTNYTDRVRCPRKFNISNIYRYRARAKATAALSSRGMNFGVRFAYDRGQCTGRCFPDNECTCDEDCAFHYEKYGYNLGCNNFVDSYPFPVGASMSPNGIWYSLPLVGRCAYPTGAPDCTWSYEHAGSITILDLEQLNPGQDQCCHGHCTAFWDNQFDIGKTYWRRDQALDVFFGKYPDQRRDLVVNCDFKREVWYKADPWKRQDPWIANCTKDEPS